jgi:hypothetical protein
MSNFEELYWDFAKGCGIMFILIIIIMIIRYIVLRYFTTQTTVIIRNFNEDRELLFNDNNIHIIILTNINNELNIMNEEDDVENQLSKCPICQDVLENNSIITECNHMYHKSCLISWISSNQRQRLKCPVCIQSLSL